MQKDFWFDSHGTGRIHGCCWTPEGKPKAVLQIVHGIAEYAQRYEEFARYLNGLGYVVVAEDHMGHGQSIDGGSTQGHFHGGWFSAVEDTYQLLQDTKAAYPGLPYVLFGHSMGSFMARTLLCKYPDSGISAAVICGTGWQPAAALPLLIQVVEAVCRKIGASTPSPRLEKLIFGSYNRKVEHPRTPYDWLTRDAKVVDAYLADPRCGFTPTAGLILAMLQGISYIEQPASLAAMDKRLPVLFIAGGDDPVGSYGKGVRQAAQAFQKAGMTDVTTRIYPLGRHEILNEINRTAVFQDIANWLKDKVK